MHCRKKNHAIWRIQNVRVGQWREGYGFKSGRQKRVDFKNTELKYTRI